MTFVGVRHLDNADLAKKTAHVSADTDAIIVEHEAGIFSDVPLIRALLGFRRRRIPVVLALHELEPEKFHHYRRLSNALHYRPRYSGLVELLRAPWVALRIANWFLRYRAVLALFGSLPRKLVVHSHRSNHWFDLLSNDERKKEHFPLVLVPLEDTVLPRDAAEKRALRERLGLPVDRFIFVSPGFFFRRKRLVDVISAAPEDSLVVLSGTRHANEPEYFDEVVAYAKERPNVVINTEYETMGQYVAAADCVVLYYENVFQSAVLAQAIWAGLPGIVAVDVAGAEPLPDHHRRDDQQQPAEHSGLLVAGGPAGHSFHDGRPCGPRRIHDTQDSATDARPAMVCPAGSRVGLPPPRSRGSG